MHSRGELMTPWAALTPAIGALIEDGLALICRPQLACVILHAMVATPGAVLIHLHERQENPEALLMPSTWLSISASAHTLSSALWNFADISKRSSPLP
jgi:hypothetical protein